MKYISWITLDTGRSICNNKSGEEMFTVYMHDNKGNIWKESDYNGFGVFGGKDFYQLMAEMNGITRDFAIQMYEIAEDKVIVYPILTESKRRPRSFKIRNLIDPSQGFFYDRLELDESSEEYDLEFYINNDSRDTKNIHITFAFKPWN